MRRLGAVAIPIAGLALAGCGGSQATWANGSQPSSRSDTERTVVEPADGPDHEVGTLGDACLNGAPERIEPPDAAWAVIVLDTVVSPSGGPIETLGRGIRVRYPRDWIAEQTTSFSVSQRDGRRVAEVYVRHLTHLGPDETAVAPWDERIEALEELNDLEAQQASPLPGGRCLVRGQALLGPFVATLSPLGPDETVVAVAGFPDAFDADRSLDEIPATSLNTAMRIMNSLEVVDDEAESTT